MPSTEIEEILKIVSDLGPSKAARATGLAKSTIYKLARDHGVNTTTDDARYLPGIQAARLEWQLRREQMNAQMSEVTAKALESLEDAIDGDQSKIGKDFATIFGILFDKLQLLTGSATVRTEFLNSPEAIHRRAAELDELAARREAKEAAQQAITMNHPSNPDFDPEPERVI